VTETQILIAIEMLDVPIGSYLYRTDQLGLNVTTFKALPDPVDANTAIRATIAGMSTERDAICQTIIDAYKNLVEKALGVSITNGGGIQSVPGLSIDFDARIKAHKNRLRAYLPFWTDWTTMVSRNAQQDVAIASVFM